MEKFKNKYSDEILDDNTGEYYDKPVDCGGFPTRHAIKRAKERRDKYKNKLYEIYEATPKTKITKSVEKEYSFYYNVNRNTKLKNIAITEDHYNIWE